MAWLWPTILAAEFGVRLLLVLHVIMRRRPVPVTMAWVLLLLLVPLAGTVLYGLVGENRLGSRRAARHLHLTTHIEERAVGLWRERHSDWTADAQAEAHLAALGTRVGGMPPLRGNSLELIGSTAAFLARLAADIDRATSHCHLLYYIWTDDPEADAVGQALARAAKRGVACRVLVDGVGARDFLRGPSARAMASAGVKVVESLPVRAWRLLLARADLRNHRKIAVIDGAVAYAGSHNLCTARYPDTWLRRGGEWIDATVRVRGPAVQALQTIFLRDWLLDSEEHIDDLEPFMEVGATRVGSDDAPGGGHGCVVHVIPSGPGPQPEAIHHALLTLLYEASEEIIMTTPYFVPDEAMKTALIVASQRGVAVTLVLPERSDMPLVGAAARSHYEDLMVAGVRIVHYTAGLLHSKTITVDRRIGLITSVNFDIRSFFLNFECSLFIYDDDFASQMRFLQTSYMSPAVSQELDLHRWQARPVHTRFVQNLAQLAGPLL
jgi:cardiolipin synthase